MQHAGIDFLQVVLSCYFIGCKSFFMHSGTSETHCLKTNYSLLLVIMRKIVLSILLYLISKENIPLNIML